MHPREKFQVALGSLSRRQILLLLTGYCDACTSSHALKHKACWELFSSLLFYLLATNWPPLVSEIIPSLVQSWTAFKSVHIILNMILLLPY